MSVELFDCTLRDGGYVNNWEFDLQSSLRIIDGLYNSGVKIIEIGIQGKKDIENGSTKFENFSDIVPLLENRKKDCKYALMCNQATIKDFKIPARNIDTVDIIRIAFFKDESESAYATATELKNKGYDVFLQAMATFMYSDGEIKKLLKIVNQIDPYAFYIVDSFSTMYNDDVIRACDSVLSVLNEKIRFGFHAHNSIQMAYSNVIVFIDYCKGKDIIVDSTIYGMGRGAGNVPTELVMKYLNKKNNSNYKPEQILELFQNELSSIYKYTPWGYLPEYFLTADKDMNPVYGWYLKNKGIVKIKDFNAVLDLIPKDISYKLSVLDVEKAIELLNRGRK